MDKTRKIIYNSFKVNEKTINKSRRGKMDWNKEILTKIDFDKINNKEEKEKVALKIAGKVQEGDVIGFGSGSTSYLTIYAIADKMKKEHIKITAIPTSYETEMLCHYLQIPTATLLEQRPDWSFDGADEVNEEKWLIKGRGGAMYREKLNIANSKITYVLVDSSKIVEKLGSHFDVPVEVEPSAINHVKEELMLLGTKEVNIRKAVSKDGPVITEKGNIILDAKFENISEHLEKDIKSITGVIESGLFIGYPVEIISA